MPKILRGEVGLGSKNPELTSSPWTLPSVPNYYTLQAKLLLKCNVKK